MVLSRSLTPDGTNGIQSIGDIMQMLRDTGSKASYSHARTLQQRQIDEATDKALDRKSKVLNQAIAINDQYMKQGEFMMNAQQHRINIENSMKQLNKQSKEEIERQGFDAARDALSGDPLSDESIASIFTLVRDDKGALDRDWETAS